jgi:Glycosyl transferase family 2
MRCATLADLPPPPPGKIGWPWTVAGPQLRDTRQDGSPWPRMSIVTPSYNQGQFIEETIRSILLQGYPTLTYGVVDGGSTDETRVVLHKYRSFLDFCISESDNGQVDAIDKGFRRLPPGLVNWINSDDVLAPGALIALGQVTTDASCVTGEVANFTGMAIESRVSPRYLSFKGFCLETAHWHQPGIWLRADPSELRQLLDQRFHVIFDWLYYVMVFSNRQTIVDAGATLAYFRVHPAAKTQQRDGTREFLAACRVALPHLKTSEQRRLMEKRLAIAERRLWAVEQLGAAQDGEVLQRFAARAFGDIGTCFDRFALGMLRRKLTASR